MDSPNTPQAAPFPPKSFESDDWVDVYQNLREDINDAFDKMGPMHLLAPRNPNLGVQVRQGVSSTGLRAPSIPQLLKHRLQITVRKLNQAHFSIVDIPGLVSSKCLPNVQPFSYTHSGV
jgi:hypothetical protein